MNLDEFREIVYSTFGPQLEHATPEAMREFICRMYAQLSPARTPEGVVEIPAETATSYEQIVIDFFARSLDSPAEQAVILLWLFAGEMYFSDLGEQYSERFSDLASPERS